MPYKLSKSKLSVMVHKNGKWVTLKTHKTSEEAKKHLAALEINVEEAKKE
jgi:hypothetical protein